MRIRQLIKDIAARSPIAITRNELYDRLTEKVIKKVCHANSVCVDIGANEGKILSMFIRHCPHSIHYAFEPIPPLYHLLKRKYSSAARIYELAISDTEGKADFNYVTTDPAYSGLLKRKYDKPEQDETIVVKTATLNTIIPATESIRLIKLDIEGGEYNALSGASRLLQSHPYILFEFGKAGAEAYKITPAMMYKFLTSRQYHINLLPGFLKRTAPLELDVFEYYYTSGKAYFFIAYP
jgi:FkbM family methyltransferase